MKGTNHKKRANLNGALIITLIFFIIVSLLSGCKKAEEKKAESALLPTNEVLTTIPYDIKKPTLVISVSDGMDWERLQEDLDKVFPEVNIVLRYGMNLESVALGEFADIHVALQPNLSPEIEAKLLDLSIFSSTNHYYNTALTACASLNNSKQYLIPLPSNIRGIVYNKTMFEENGWKVPQGRSKFIALCHTIEDSGVVERAFQPALYFAAEALIIGEFFQETNMFDTLDFFSWYENYAKKGIGSADFFLPSFLDTYDLLFKENVLSPTDFSLRPALRSAMLYRERTAAMTTETQNATQYALDFGSTDEFAMMPFYSSDDPESGYVVANPIAYLAVSAKVVEPGNEAKLAIVEKFLDYIATKEGQDLFIPKGNIAISQIKNAEKDITGNAMLENVQSVINAGRMIPVRAIYNAGINLSRNAIFDVLNNMYYTERRNHNIIDEDRPVTYEEAVEYLDNINKEAIASAESKLETIYGEVSQTFTVLETTEYYAQMIKDATDSDIALYLNNTLCRGNNIALYEGELIKTVGGVYPFDALATIDCSIRTQKVNEDDLKIAKIKMSGAQILAAIEYPTNIEKSYLFEPFFISAGLKIEFAPWAEKGSRYLKVTLADGSELVPDKLYTVAIWNNTIDPEYITEYVKIYDDSFRDLLQARLAIDKKIAPINDGRFTINWDVVKEQ